MSGFWVPYHEPLSSGRSGTTLIILESIVSHVPVVTFKGGTCQENLISEGKREGGQEEINQRIYMHICTAHGHRQ